VVNFVGFYRYRNHYQKSISLNFLIILSVIIARLGIVEYYL